jgi:hypothetical protein
MDSGCQAALQHWLDHLLETSNIDRTGSSTTTPPATPAIVPIITGLGTIIATDTSTFSTTDSLPSTPQPGTNVATSSLNSDQPDPSIDTDLFTDTSFHGSSATTIVNEASISYTSHLKRSFSGAESTKSASGRSTKSARVEVSDLAKVANLAHHETEIGFAHHILGLSAWLETVSEKEKASKGAMKVALERGEQQKATMTSMQDEKKSLEGRIYELQDQRDTTVGVGETAEAKVRELEAESIQLRSDSQAYKKDIDILRGQSERGPVGAGSREW